MARMMDAMSLHDLLEEQCILRLPDELADKMRDRMKPKSTDAFRGISIETLDRKGKRMKFHFFDGKTYDAQLLSLPCHVETFKSGDSGNYFKSQDVAQVLKVYAHGEAPWAKSDAAKNKSSRNLKDGLTPPTRNIMEKRWMKNEYSREIPKGIQEMEDEIISFLSGKPKEVWRFVEMEERMRDWTDGPEGHVEESMMLGAEALERTYKGVIPSQTSSSRPSGSVTNKISPTVRSHFEFFLLLLTHLLESRQRLNT